MGADRVGVAAQVLQRKAAVAVQREIESMSSVGTVADQVSPIVGGKAEERQ
ncbi:hypothetical protein [Streptomonospora alba]|uniref:hypothetical protein n=1 Tax=Streptomonospora alba TaxID=183763 RepID=UPI0012ED1003|nr:hypothetical protein [Streptomonospora alba]